MVHFEQVTIYVFCFFVLVRFLYINRHLNQNQNLTRSWILIVWVANIWFETRETYMIKARNLQALHLVRLRLLLEFNIKFCGCQNGNLDVLILKNLVVVPGFQPLVHRSFLTLFVLRINLSGFKIQFSFLSLVTPSSHPHHQFLRRKIMLTEKIDYTELCWYKTYSVLRIQSAY